MFTHGELSCNVHVVYNVFNSMRISITSCGNEVCDVYDSTGAIKKNYSCIEICDGTEFTKHRAKYRAARVKDKKDIESNTARPQDFKVSADADKN